MPLVQTAAMRSSALSRSPLKPETKTAHLTFPTSYSAHPGRGSESPWSLWAVTTIPPSGLARTSFVLEVSTSKPRSRPLTSYPRTYRDLCSPVSGPRVTSRRIRSKSHGSGTAVRTPSAVMRSGAAATAPGLGGQDPVTEGGLLRGRRCAH